VAEHLGVTPTPKKVEGLPGIVTDVIVTGCDHVCALVVGSRIGGEVYCWGLNGAGQLGQGYTNGTLREQGGSSTPLRVKGLNVNGVADVVALFGGHYRTCAKLASQHVLCWGWSREDTMLGTAKTDVFVTLPAVMQDLCA
jgi:alpha-tubulin suppressor-like RCC1 family protein